MDSTLTKNPTVKSSPKDKMIKNSDLLLSIRIVYSYHALLNIRVHWDFLPKLLHSALYVQNSPIDSLETMS